MKFIFRNTEEFRPKTNCLDAKTGRRHELEIGGGPGDWSISTESEILAADLAMNRPWTMVMPARYAFPLIPNDLGLTNRRQCVFVAGRKAPLSWDRKTDTLEEIASPASPAPPAPPAPPAEETDPYVDAVLTLAERGNPVAKTLVDLVAAEVAAQSSAEQPAAAEAPAESPVNVVPAEEPAPVDEKPEAPALVEEPTEELVAAEAPAEQPVAAEEPAQAAKKRANDLAARAKAAVK